MSTVVFLVWVAFGVAFGVYTTFVAERERKRGASRWSWMALWALGLVLLSFGFFWVTWMAYS